MVLNNCVLVGMKLFLLNMCQSQAWVMVVNHDSY